MSRLSIIVASTRPGRVGLPIGQWFLERAKAHGKFDAQLVDLKEVGLPLFDEPRHPMMRDYHHEHTKRWSSIVAASDAFALVTPEYNYNMAPSLLNALDFLYHEWNYKPAGFVSYGGLSGGMRAAQMTRLLLTTLKVVPLPESVTITFFKQLMAPTGEFTGSEALEKSASTMLDELFRWSNALAPLRAEPAP